MIFVKEKKDNTPLKMGQRVYKKIKGFGRKEKNMKKEQEGIKRIKTEMYNEGMEETGLKQLTKDLRCFLIKHNLPPKEIGYLTGLSMKFGASQQKQIEELKEELKYANKTFDNLNKVISIKDKEKKELKQRIKQSRDVLTLCSLIDKSGQAKEESEKIDELLNKN